MCKSGSLSPQRMASALFEKRNLNTGCNTGTGFGLRKRRTVFSLHRGTRVGGRAAAAREPPLRAAAASTEDRRNEPLEARRLWSSSLNDAHIIFIIAVERPAQHGLRTRGYLAARTTDACWCQACATELLLPLLSIWLGRQQRPRARACARAQTLRFRHWRQ